MPEPPEAVNSWLPEPQISALRGDIVGGSGVLNLVIKKSLVSLKEPETTFIRIKCPTVNDVDCEKVKLLVEFVPEKIRGFKSYWVDVPILTS